MKIPLIRGNQLGAERYVAAFSIKGIKTVPQLNVEAIIDTGCPFTFLSIDTLRRSRLPYSKLPVFKVVKLTNIGIELRDLGEVEFYFLDKNNAVQKIAHKLYVGVPQVPGGQLNVRLPSFLGKDFMDANRLGIIFDKDGNPHLYRDDE